MRRREGAPRSEKYAVTFPVLDGKVAIVTDAATGVGEEAAKLFAEACAQVAITDFADESYADIRTFTRMSRGGHFTAWEDPQAIAAASSALADQVDTGAAPLRGTGRAPVWRTGSHLGRLVDLVPAGDGPGR